MPPTDLWHHLARPCSPYPWTHWLIQHQGNSSPEATPVGRSCYLHAWIPVALSGYGQRSSSANRKPGGPQLWYKDQLKDTLKQCKINSSHLETAAADRSLWRSLCHKGVKHLKEKRVEQRTVRHQHRHDAVPAPPPQSPDTGLTCPERSRICRSRIRLHRHLKWHRRQNKDYWQPHPSTRKLCHRRTVKKKKCEWQRRRGRETEFVIVS